MEAKCSSYFCLFSPIWACRTLLCFIFVKAKRDETSALCVVCCSFKESCSFGPLSSSASPPPVHRRWKIYCRWWCFPEALLSSPRWPSVDLNPPHIGNPDIAVHPNLNAILGRFAGNVLPDKLLFLADIQARVEEQGDASISPRCSVRQAACLPCDVQVMSVCHQTAGCNWWGRIYCGGMVAQKMALPVPSRLVMSTRGWMISPVRYSSKLDFRGLIDALAHPVDPGSWKVVLTRQFAHSSIAILLLFPLCPLHSQRSH